ncbi:MAG: hypothetical protein ACREXT_10900, partial [Gammaproteobacteria bacterium]
TFGSTVAPTVGIVSAANSLVGSTAGDRIGGIVNFLSFSNRLLVRSDTWNVSRGMAAFVDPNAPPVGAVTAANSLIGTNPDNPATSTINEGDRVGNTFQQLFTVDNQGLVALRTSFWNNNSGAVTIVNADAPIVGAVSALNSLVGRPGDSVGSSGISEFSNSSLIVWSPEWSDGTDQHFGAVTHMTAASPVMPVVGFVSALNSVVGSNLDDRVGSGFFTTLDSGNLVIRSPFWNSNRGALTFDNIDTGRTGVVSAANSFVGEAPDDFIGSTNTFGSSGVTPLSGDRYLVRSPLASFGGIVGAGRLDVIDAAVVTPVTGDIGFSVNPAGELLIAIDSVIAFLAGGGSLNLQANNDIFLPFGADLFASGGSITFRAGRSIEIESNLVLTDGSLTFIANDTGGDPAFRDAGDGNFLMRVTTAPIRVEAKTVSVDAQNVIIEAGSAPGAYAALIGTDSTQIIAHGSGLVELIGGTDPAGVLGDPVSSTELFGRFLEDRSAITAPAAFILGGARLEVTADNIDLTGGGSPGAFAALVSFGEFSIDAIDIALTPGTGLNADATILALGGLLDIEFDTCTGCGAEPLLTDPFLDTEAGSGIFISGLLESPATDAILAMLDRAKEDDDDDDDDDDVQECGI